MILSAFSCCLCLHRRTSTAIFFHWFVVLRNSAVAVLFNCFARIYLLLIIDRTFIIISLHVNWQKEEDESEKRGKRKKPSLVKNSYKNNSLTLQDKKKHGLKKSEYLEWKFGLIFFFGIFSYLWKIIQFEIFVYVIAS